jgi:uncharacterized membrane protein
MENDIKNDAQSNTNRKNGMSSTDLSIIISEGVKVITNYYSSKNEADKNSLEKSIEFEKEELNVIDKMDVREKIFKGILIAICLAALIFVSMYLRDSSQAIIPVISLIIGLLFRSSSMSDFLTLRKGSKESQE